MKQVLIIMAIFASHASVFAQHETFIKDASRRQTEQKKWKYFQGFDNAQKQLIRDNWTQYFKEDIYSRLDPAGAGNVYQIAFDSYGSVYPDLALLKGIDFNKSRRWYSDNWAFSLYDEFLKNNEKIEANLEGISLSNAAKDIYHKVLTTEDDSLFYAEWDAFHDKKAVDGLNSRLENRQYKQVIFFVHGYNVPYSLAVVQLISFKRMLRDSVRLSTDSILFVPVFWSSNDSKNNNIDTKETFDITNKTGIANGGLFNAFYFWYYSNRAYYASIGLRKLINGIKRDDVKVTIFAHSLGSVIATSALINTFSKLDDDPATIADIKTAYQNHDREKLYQQKRENPVTYEIVTGFLENPVPERKVNVFLSAPAIPGVNTFTDISTAQSNNYKFYTTLNKTDEMLTKKISGIRGVNEYNFSVTSLGCSEEDAKETKQKYPNKKNEEYKEVSRNPDHDIFTYMNQQQYIDFIKAFFKER